MDGLSGYGLRSGGSRRRPKYKRPTAIAATRTPATVGMFADPERMKRTFERYIVRRPGEPDDIANMALFLASDASSWITGQTYPVNGGFTLAL